MNAITPLRSRRTLARINHGLFEVTDRRGLWRGFVWKVPHGWQAGTEVGATGPTYPSERAAARSL